MTGNKCLLDTNVIIDVFRDKAIAKRLNEVSEVYVPVEAVGELYYGAYNSTDPYKNVSQIRFFLLSCKILYQDLGTAEAYGRIKSALRKKGRPIPENDIWIAALPSQHEIPLFTSDAHFSEIDDINLFF